MVKTADRGRHPDLPPPPEEGSTQDGEDYGPYHMGQKDADAILAHAKGKPLKGAHGTAVTKVQRHRLKWLPSAESSITIPLSKAEHAAVGGTLKRVKV